MSGMIDDARAVAAVLVVALTLAASVRDASAQPAARRDPTRPPAGYGASPAAVVDPIAGFRPESLLFAEGRRYLVWHGRRYAVGDEVEGARIERIEDQAVWLRTAQGVREMRLFAGVEKNDRERTK